MPGGDTSGESPCVVASPAQFSDRGATNLKSADAINDDRPVPRQLLDPLCQRCRSVQGGTGQHVGASWQVSRLTEIEQYRSPLLCIVKRGVQFLRRNPRLVLRRRTIGQEQLVYHFVAYSEPISCVDLSPIQVCHHLIDIGSCPRAEMVGVLVHVECEDRGSARQSMRMVRRPVIDQPAEALGPGEDRPS